MPVQYVEIIEDLKKLDYFSDMKYRRRGHRFYRKINGMQQYIELRYFLGYNELVIDPSYNVRFDVLHKWYEKFSYKTLQGQRDAYTFGASASMLDPTRKDSLFYFSRFEDMYEQEFERLKNELIQFSDMFFTEYSSLEKAYTKKIVPILDGTGTLFDGGADWIFEYLALCKLVAPEKFKKLREIMLSHIELLHSRNEPNVAMYYGHFEEYFDYLEYNDVLK